MMIAAINTQDRVMTSPKFGFVFLATSGCVAQVFQISYVFREAI
jgi:hypothetical protein